MELPFVDEHEVTIDAPPDATWEAVSEVFAASFEGTMAAWFAALIGCADLRVSGRLEEPGATMVGFHVVRSEQPVELALEGSHRFSRYALVFRIDDLGGGRSRLRAETRAEFPGALGRVYRALVIGSGGHVVAVRRVLGLARKRALRKRGSAAAPR